MRSFLLLLLPCLFSLALAAPRASLESQKYVVHEKRDFIPNGWIQRGRVPQGYEIPVGIALKQNELHNIEEYLRQVSDPDSHQFGQHWEADKVRTRFAPSQETVKSVSQWLDASGIASHRLSQSSSLGWLNFKASAVELERLLQTDFHLYQHSDSQQWTVATKAYSLPKDVQPHVDFITPTLHFVRSINKRDDARNHQRDDPHEHEQAHVDRRDVALGSPQNGFLPKERPLEDPFSVLHDLANCSKAIVPICLRALYGLPLLLGPQVSKDPLGILEFTPQSYVQNDLDTFFKDYQPDLLGRKPELVTIDGGYVNSTATGFDINGESNLDLQYAMSLSQLSTKLFQVGDGIANSSFSDFLDAVDGSFCANDDPTQDGIYPDNNSTAHAYKGPKQCGGVAASDVISVSYGQDEQDLTPLYANRQCQEYAKLGLQGKTFVFSSGDYGVAGNSGVCSPNNVFNPGFPATCPYILSVGATQVKNDTNVVTDFQAEVACNQVIYSGGGFSNIFKRPWYQDDAVNTYLSKHAPDGSLAGKYNTTGTRAFPDISANGANYRVNVGGQYKRVYGTSASAPVWASLIARLNENRNRIGKKSIGFINPILYKYFNNGKNLILKDITQGNNPGCGTQGFSAVEGYDPVTGLGTPNFEPLNALLLSLP
ncbi:unnamed protein product [Sympodiomycopsis kandeliae]